MRRFVMRHLSARSNTRGFTLIEVIVVITVAAILTPIVLNALGDYYYANIYSLQQTTQNTDARSVLRSVEDDLAYSPGFLASFNAPDPLLGPSNSTGGSRSWIANRDKLIATTYTTATVSGQRVPVIDQRTPSDDCSQPEAGMMLRTTIIYFVATDLNDSSVSNLYRRTIVGDPASLCPGTPTTFNQKTTCRANVTAGVCARSTQTGVDAVLMRDIDSITLQYFAQPNDTTPMSATANPASATAVSLTVLPKQRGNVVPESVSIRITPIR
jgi:prepilin-type N-terminal cleavage/methylation domain-containing protein